MRVHLLDGTYELFRHFFAVPSHRDPGGTEVGAVRGVLGTVLTILEDGATHLGVATDHVIESFRNELWPGYKTGAGVDPDLLAQFPLLEEAIEALGIRVWAMVEQEADDALAAAAEHAAADGRVEQVLICTPDKDLAQCVAEARVVQLDRRNRRLFDEAGVREKFGVGPASIPDWLALVGDSADGFPGLPGWGAKSASVVLARYEHLEEIPERRDRLGRGRARGREARRYAGGAARPRDAVPRSRHPAHRRAGRGGGRLAMARARARVGGVGGAARRPRDGEARTSPRGAEGKLIGLACTLMRPPAGGPAA